MKSIERHDRALSTARNRHNPLGQKYQTHRTRTRRQIPCIRNIRRPPELRRQTRRTLPTHLACLHRVSKCHNTRKGVRKRDQRVNDCAVSL